jgi:hypothetical protein
MSDATETVGRFQMPDLDFVTDYEPLPREDNRGRKAEPNPFDAVISALAATWNSARNRTGGAVTLVIPIGETRTRVEKKFNDAANKQGYTARFDDKASQNGLSVMAAYLVNQVTRQSKKDKKGHKGITISFVKGSPGDLATRELHSYPHIV